MKRLDDVRCQRGISKGCSMESMGIRQVHSGLQGGSSSCRRKWSVLVQTCYGDMDSHILTSDFTMDALLPSWQMIKLEERRGHVSKNSHISSGSAMIPTRTITTLHSTRALPAKSHINAITRCTTLSNSSSGESQSPTYHTLSWCASPRSSIAPIKSHSVDSDN